MIFQKTQKKRKTKIEECQIIGQEGRSEKDQTHGA
jgi:hypothetical protein